MYANGKGIQQNHVKAIEWYRRAADQGDIIARYNLGWSYANGKGVQQDNAKAKEWYSKACDLGNKDSCKSLQKLSEKE